MNMKQLTFDRKMIRFISLALIFATAVIIFISAGSTVLTLTRKSAQMAGKEAEVMAANMEDNFNQYQSLIWSLVLDQSIQTWLSSDSPPEGNVDNVYQVLDNACNMWENINFISIIHGSGTHLTKGKAIPNRIVNYIDKLTADYENSIPMGNNSAMRLLFTNEYHSKGKYSLLIYYPLYSDRVYGRRLGTLCIDINDANLLQLLPATGGFADTARGMKTDFMVETFFLHKDGRIITAADTARIGETWQDEKNHNSRPLTLNLKNLIIHKKLSRWDFTYIIRIGWWELLKDSVRTVLVLVLMLVFFIFWLVRLARRMVTKAYRPWGNVVTAMEKVAGGELDTRLPVSESTPDMQVVSVGFNGMMEQILKLMQQVKEEQFLIDRIRMEALQSQIQPHFLYNTLDCIHWQAVGSGNREISGMVKALAAYYRLCLSKGKDIITIGEELEYTRNYLYIQQIRYGDILNYEITAASDSDHAIIPKLTLQPLVENAIYHGIKKREGQRGRILITVSRADDDIRIDVADNGGGMSEDKINEMNQMISMNEEEFGYGVRNVNRRIKLYYGLEYGLTYYRNEEDGVTAAVRIPKLTKLKERHVLLS